MRLAVSTWNGRVSPVFDVARTLLVLDTGAAGAIERREQPLAEGAALQTQQIAGAGVDVLLCGAISRPLADMLAARGVKVVPFISGDVEQVVRAYLAGGFERGRFAMPGCRRRGGGAGRRGHGWGRRGGW